MRVGVSLNSSYRVQDVRQGASWMVERAAAAAEAGLDSLFVGDHHVMPAPYFQNTVIMGRMLAEWDSDRPAGCLFLLPLWNPVLLAEQVGTLASLMRGRFILQCALGDGRQQFGGMGVDIRQRPSRFEESLDIVRRLLAGETVEGGRRFPFASASIHPTPPERVEVWIGGSAEASVDRAARLGDGYLGGPELTPGKAAHWSAFYRERSAAHSRTPAANAIRRDVFVGRDDEHAAAVAGPIIAAGYRGFDPSALIHGGPETVARAFRELAAVGYTDVIIRHLTNDQEQVLGSMKRLKAVKELVADA